MLMKVQTLGGAVLLGLLVSSACSSSSSDGGSAGSGGAHAGSGGTATGGGGHAGTVSSGGTHAGGGGGGKAGTGGATAGKGGMSDNGAGAGGEGGAATCPGCASGFCLGDGTCVDCLPSNDHCPAAQYCTDANTCAPGCKANGSNCASGVCLASHDCKNCISDAECSPGNVCGAGICAPACSAAQEGLPANCAAGLTCCSLHCSDLSTDSNHCGACGTACGGSQFCGLTACSGGGEAGAGGASGQACVACHDIAIANLCSINAVIVISDKDKNSTDGNLAPARDIAAALKTDCSPSPTVTEELQNSQDALNITTGHPVSGGGTLLVVAGGPFFQNLEGYFEQSSSPLYYMEVGDTEQTKIQQFVSRASGQAVVSRSKSADNLSHDFFIIQFMRDAGSGSLVLNEQGFWQSGTTAAAFYFANVIAPAFSSYDKAWYAYEWTDADGDMAPDVNEIVLQGSAP
jgi:hypothetical protein